MRDKLSNISTHGVKSLSQAYRAMKNDSSTILRIQINLYKMVGTEFTPADQLFFDQVKETAVANEKLRQAVMANSLENFKPVFNKQLENLFIERMDGNEEIFIKLMNDESFKNVASAYLVEAVYQKIKQG